MKVVRIEATAIRIPFPRARKFTGHTLTHTDNVLLKLTTDEGLVGIGEAMARPYVYGESHISIMHALKEWLAPLLLGVDPFDIERVWSGFDRIAFNFTAKGAADVALHDLMAQAVGLPLYKFLGGWTDQVPLTWIIPFYSINEMVSEAEQQFGAGYRSFKVKVGEDPAKDIELIKCLRTALGAEALIYADANEGYDLPTAVRTIRSMEAYGLAFVEDPLPVDDHEGRRRLCQSITVPILADESAKTVAEAHQELTRGTAGIVDIKIPRTGYFLSRKILNLAEAAGIPCLVGGQGESGVGALASAHFAAAFRNAQRYPSEVSGPVRLTEDTLLEPFPVVNGTVRLPSAPGTGVRLNEELVRKLETAAWKESLK
jgi:L-alanine-DL-glutamate epimerase-like enolase superfamily enzyme